MNIGLEWTHQHGKSSKIGLLNIQVDVFGYKFDFRGWSSTFLVVYPFPIQPPCVMIEEITGAHKVSTNVSLKGSLRH